MLSFLLGVLLVNASLYRGVGCLDAGGGKGVSVVSSRMRVLSPGSLGRHLEKMSRILAIVPGSECMSGRAFEE